MALIFRCVPVLSRNLAGKKERPFFKDLPVQGKVV